MATSASMDDPVVPSTTEDPRDVSSSTADILVPPVVGLLLIVTGLVALSLWKQPRWWQRVYTRQNANGNNSPLKRFSNTEQNSCCDPDDIATLEEFQHFQNNPKALLKVALPCIVTIVLSPIVIALVPVMWDFFFPFDEYKRKSNINGTLSPFLLPSSLVYSLAWGFALQDALAKFDVTDANTKHHYAMLKHIRELVLRSQGLSVEYKLNIIKHVFKCTTQWMRRQMGYPNRCNAIWYILETFELGDNTRENKIMETLVAKAMELDSLMEEGYRGAAASINKLQWVFMESLGFIAFFGILLINADSYRLELTMCVMTVFTISSFAYILSDLDYAYHGTFCVDLDIFVTFLEEIDDDYMHIKASQDKTKLANYSEIIPKVLMDQESEAHRVFVLNQRPGPLYGQLNQRPGPPYGQFSTAGSSYLLNNEPTRTMGYM